MNPGTATPTKSCTIVNGASLSDEMHFHDARPTRVSMPAAWTAASLTFQVSYDGVNYQNLYDSAGNEYTVVAAAARDILLPIADFLGVRAMKIRSGTAGTPVNQGADRALAVVLVP